MTIPVGQHPGAKWRKCDFQIHTPRDEQWTGLRSPSNNPELEAARDEWAAHFVAECLHRNLSAIAITDHHDTVFIPYLQKAIADAEATDSLWLFPGMEVTCDDDAQCIVLFDVRTPQKTVQRLFGGHLNVTECSPAETIYRKVQTCGKEVIAFIEGIFQDPVFRGTTIVLPHGGNHDDHKSVLRKRFQERWKTLDVDGAYAGRPYTELNQGTLNKLHGRDPEWGNRRRGVVVTGDSRDDNFSRLGTNECWIRLGEPTTEAIRQALLADEARISYKPPSSPAHRILKLHVNSALTGNDFTVSFNEGCNAFIGGRGSGKTALLEYLRFALGRSSLDIALLEKESVRREQDLLSNTLSGGRVRLYIERDGVEEVWERTLATRQTITVVGINGPEVLSVEQAQGRFYARAFSQKQLSTLISDLQDADEQITGIAAAEVRGERQASLAEIGRHKQETRLAFESVVLYWQLKREASQLRTQLADVERRHDKLTSELKAAGLSQEAQQALADDTKYKAGARQLDQMGQNLRRSMNGVSNLRDELTSLLNTLPPSSDFVEIAECAGILQSLAKRVDTAMVSIVEDIHSGLTAFEQAKSAFEQKRTSHDRGYSAAVAQQQSLESQLKALGSLSSEKESLTAEVDQAETSVTRQAHTEQILANRKSELTSQIEHHKSILEKAAKQVEWMSKGMLKASVYREHIPAEYLAAFAEICDNVRIQNHEARSRDTLGTALAADGTGWEKIVDSLVELLREKTLSALKQPTESQFDALKAIFGPLTSQQAQGIFARIDSSRIASLVSATTADYIAFSYRDRDTFIDFSLASPGQQAAALLTLLLNQEAGTLIIDQPEDDLDNRVIMDIVKQVCAAKTKRQLIFATHNANIVVNGDADKVIVLKPAVQSNPNTGSEPRISIEVDGAIETPALKRAITSTLEGGDKAFELRRRKYHS